MQHLIFIVPFVALSFLISSCSPREDVYRESISPDGLYKIEVVRHPVYFSMMPGQSSDAPGTIRLTDRRGRILKEAPVAMVQLVEHIDWGPQRVTIKLLVDWELPPEVE